MKTLLAMAAGLTLFTSGVALSQNDEAELKKANEQLKGTWKVETFEAAQGLKDEFVGATLSFSGDKIEFAKDNDVKKGSFSINPAGKPKEIDIKPEGKDEPILGIYRIENDTLTICLAEGQNASRPNAFEAKERNVVAKLKKVKQ